MNIIKFCNENTTKAEILLGRYYETFELNTTDWNKSDYIKQWIHAIKSSLDNRDISGIFKNYEKTTPSEIKNMGIYTIIPEEIAYSQSENNNTKDFYITESFKFVTEKIEILDDDQGFDLINECYGNYFPIYYLNINKLSHFYLYLSEQVEGVSHWKVTENDLKETLNFLMSELK